MRTNTKKCQVKRNKNLVWRDLWCSVCSWCVYKLFFHLYPPASSVAFAPLAIIFVHTRRRRRRQRQRRHITLEKAAPPLYLALSQCVLILLLSLLACLLFRTHFRSFVRSLTAKPFPIWSKCAPFFFLSLFSSLKQEIEEKYIRQIHNKS